MKHHLRIAALQCNFQDEAHTLAMPEKWHSMGFSGEQLLHTHADLYSAIFDPERHGKLLEKYLERSREQQLETIVYMNCHILGPSIAGNFETWALRDADGVTYPRFYGTYYGCCLNSPWKAYFFNCIRALKRYEIAGLFFDGPFYTPCGCPVCRKAFEERMGKPYAAATELERKEFAFERVIAFKDELYQLVKSVNPAWLMYFNEGLFAGRSGRKNMLRQLKSDDIIGTEGGFFFYGPPKNQNYWRCGSCAKLAEAVAAGRRTVIFQAGDHKRWGWFMHTPAETKLCYASALFNGAGIWYGIHCNPENLDTEAGKAASAMLHFDKAHEELWEKSRSLAETAVFYSFDTAARYPKEGESSDLYASDARGGLFPGNYTKSFQGALAMLEHRSIAYDLVTELNLQDLFRYKKIVLPNFAIAAPEVLEALKAYVEAGGTVIADGEFGRYDEEGQLVPEGNKTFGIVFDGSARQHSNFNYMTVDPELYQADNAFGYLPSPQWTLGIAVAPYRCRGLCTKPLSGCYEARPGKGELPFLFDGKQGKGRVVYLAGGFFESYSDFSHLAFRELLNAFLAPADFALVNAEPGITFSVRESAGGTFLGLCNYVSPLRPIVKPAVMRSLKLRVPERFTAAEELFSHKKLRRDAGGCFVLEELQDVSCVLLS